MNVLVIAYNRPDLADKLFQVLRLIKPEQLFISFDGPDPSVEDDQDKCRNVREVFDEIDWECNVKVKKHTENVGCNNNVLQAIDWFFDHVEEGIIVEDDCLPDPTFFYYCQTLLEKYKNNDSVFMISGANFISMPASEFSYRTTSLVNIWGWATWQRAWSKRIKDLAIWPFLRDKGIFDCYGGESERQKKLIEDQYAGIAKFRWGTLWRLTCLMHASTNLISNINLVKNMGFNRIDSTHTCYEHPVSDNPVYYMGFPLKHPDIDESSGKVYLDEQALRWYYNNLK